MSNRMIRVTDGAGGVIEVTEKAAAALRLTAGKPILAKPSGKPKPNLHPICTAPAAAPMPQRAGGGFYQGRLY